ncbi:MAG: hypothetical protein CFE34_15530 [Rhodobacteraceae bacterium PARR1]|nr:MAG: hypothetical protein CFE34_15530 [Rhodobacteraceae bacterium PARR1]
MPETSMDYWVIAGVVFTALCFLVTFMRRPKKTTNIAERSERVDQRGGEGTTTNTAKDSRDVRQQG